MKEPLFEDEPPLGTVVTLDLQRYVLVGYDTYKAASGDEFPVLVWRAHCADCDREFEARAKRESSSLTRRCEKCREEKGRAKVIPGKRSTIVKVFRP